MVQGAQDDSELKFNYVNELYEAKKAELKNKDQRIRVLEEELSNMSSLAKGMIPFQEISQEARINYENLDRLSFAYTLQTDFKKTDTIPVFEVSWKNDNTTKREEDLKRLSDWLQVRLKNPKIQVRQAGG